MMAQRPKDEDFVTMSEEQKRSRRSRSVALAVALVAFVVVMYLVTVVKMGPAVLDRMM